MVRDQLFKFGLFAFLMVGVFWHLLAAGQLFNGDEILTLYYANSYGWNELLTQSLDMAHPNTYYLLVKGLFSLSESLLTLRLFSLFVFLACLLAVWQLTKVLAWSTRWRLLAIGLFSWWGYGLRFGFLVRMYGLAMMLVLVSVWLSLRYVRRDDALSLWLSFFVDLLGLLVSYGYGLLLLVKLTSLLAWTCDAEVQLWLKRMIVGLGTGALLYFSGLIDVAHIFEQGLYWKPQANWGDLGLGVLAMLGAGGFAYFEGYAAFGASSQIISMLFLLGVVSGLWWHIKHGYLACEDASKQWLSILCGHTLLLLVGLFLFDLVFDWPVYHIRQVFGLAVIIWLYAVVLLKTVWSNNSRLGSGLLLAFFVLSSWHVWGNFTPGAQAYQHSYVSKVPEPVLFDRKDVGVAFHQCGAYSFDEMRIVCPEHQRYLVTSSEDVLTQMKALDGPVMITGVAYFNWVSQRLPNIECKARDVRYYLCRLS